MLQHANQKHDQTQALMYSIPIAKGIAELCKWVGPTHYAEMSKKNHTPCSRGCSSAAPVIPVHSYKSVMISLLLESGSLSGGLFFLRVSGHLSSLCFPPYISVCCPKCRTSPKLLSGSRRAVIPQLLPWLLRRVRGFEHCRAGKTP